MTKPKLKTTNADRARLLNELYDLHLQALIEQLKDKKTVTAAALAAAQRTLTDNAINLSTFVEEESSDKQLKALRDSVSELPAFSPHYE